MFCWFDWGVQKLWIWQSSPLNHLVTPSCPGISLLWRDLREDIRLLLLSPHIFLGWVPVREKNQVFSNDMRSPVSDGAPDRAVLHGSIDVQSQRRGILLQQEENVLVLWSEWYKVHDENQVFLLRELFSGTGYDFPALQGSNPPPEKVSEFFHWFFNCLQIELLKSHCCRCFRTVLIPSPQLLFPSRFRVWIGCSNRLSDDWRQNLWRWNSHKEDIYPVTLKVYFRYPVHEISLLLDSPRI